MSTTVFERRDIAPGTACFATAGMTPLAAETFAAVGPGLRTEAVVESMLSKPIIIEALELLQRELPGRLCYHNLEHTNNAIRWGVTLALHDGLTEKEVELIAVAAAWHDTGFTKRYAENEEVGAALAVEAMAKHGYSKADMDTVKQMILDTQLKPTADGLTIEQVSSGRLSGYMLDADLANFGWDTFLKTSVKVYNEIFGAGHREACELLATEQGERFLCGTMRLITNHRWQTEAGAALLQEEKESNIARLAAILAGPVV